jgi:outer membrane receptor protein involved in Fe transport
LIDLNLIPFNFIDRIDILKDGATTRYGSDAVAGVANVILRDSLPRGSYGEFDFLYGNTTNNDQATINLTAFGGFSNDKVKVIGAYDYYHRNAIFSRDRFISSNADARRFGGRDTRSVNQPGNASIAVGGGDAGTFTVNTTNTTPTSLADYRAFDAGSAGVDDLFNFRTYTPSKPEFLRDSVMASVDAQIFGKYLEAFGTFVWTKSRFYDALAPTPGPIDGSVAALSPYYPGASFAGRTIDPATGLPTDFGDVAGISSQPITGRSATTTMRLCALLPTARMIPRNKPFG